MVPKIPRMLKVNGKVIGEEQGLIEQVDRKGC